MRFALRLIISTGVIFGVAYLSRGQLLVVDGVFAAVGAALVLAIVNAFVRPVVALLALPVTILTLGLFALVVNALMIYLVSWVVPGVETVGFFRTVVAAVIISVATSIVSRVIQKD